MDKIFWINIVLQWKASIITIIYSGNLLTAGYRAPEVCAIYHGLVLAASMNVPRRDPPGRNVSFAYPRPPTSQCGAPPSSPCLTMYRPALFEFRDPSYNVLEFVRWLISTFRTRPIRLMSSMAHFMALCTTLNLCTVSCVSVQVSATYVTVGRTHWWNKHCVVIINTKSKICICIQITFRLNTSRADGKYQDNMTFRPCWSGVSSVTSNQRKA